MTNPISTALINIRKDRAVLFVCIAILFAAALSIAYISTQLSVHDLQIATRFTEFGDTQLYRNKWYYLFNFIGMIFLIASVHITLIGKLVQRGMRPHAIAFGWGTIFLIICALLIARQVFGIAYLP